MYFVAESRLQISITFPLPKMDTENGAFPNAWDGKGQGGGRKGQKGHREGDEKGRKGGKGHGKRHGKGKGHGENGRGKGDGNRDEESLPSERKDYLEAQLVALSNGTEPSAVPRVGDLVQVMKVMGTDPEQLQGKTGEVIGVALLPSLKTSGGAVTVRLNQAESVDVSVGASDLRILEAVQPLPEGSLTFPKTLTGLERKFVHAVSERIGLISQSFGKGEDRYITVFRAAAGSRTCGLDREDSIAVPTGNIEVSGVELDHESKLALLEAVTIPEGWIISADRMVICRGPLQKPKQMDHRSVARQCGM